jgi:hypothetical protein
MKKLVFMITIFALLMVVAIPVIASKDSDLDYINSIRTSYMEKVADQGLTMIYDDVFLLKAGEAYTFPLTVGRGDYEIWGFGGRGIRNLNIEIYSANGDSLAASKLGGNTPVLSFSEPVSRSHKVEYESAEFDPGVSQGYFLIVVVRK